MAQREKSTATKGGNRSFPKEAYEYRDDVSAEAVQKIRAERGVDVSDRKWKVIEALGQVVQA